jgi:hypothetical protein
MADAGETWDSSLGEVSQDDVRIILLLDLMDDGDITKKEAQDILKWSESYDDPKQIIGVLAGELGVATKSIEGALEGTEWAINAEDIEETGRGFEAWKQEVTAAEGTGAHTTALTMRNFLSWPTDMLADWTEAGGGLYMDLVGAIDRNVTSPLWNSTVQPASDYVRGKDQEDRQIRTDVQAAVRNELDKLLEEGYIGQDEWKTLKNETGDYGADNYDALVAGLMKVYEKYDDPSAYEQAMHDNLVLAVQTRADKEREKSPPENTTGVTTPGEEGVQKMLTSEQAEAKRAEKKGDFSSLAVPSDGAYGRPEDWESNRITDVSVTGFDNYLRASGYENDPDIPSVDYGKPAERASFTGEDRVLDPSTGGSFTEGEWRAIKTDPRARADYLLNKQVSPAIQQLLNTGRFSQQPILNARGEPTGKYRDSDDPTLLPISNLEGAFPSPVVSNPWESSTFDYAAGQGRMEWIGLGSMAQKRFITQMHNQGLISTDQFDDWTQPVKGAQEWSYGLPYTPITIADQSYNLVAMGIYEQATSFASQFQKKPEFAINMMGQAARTYQQPRSYSGGGRIAPVYSVPSSLRTVPNYKSLAQDSKAVFSQEVGRDMEDWELALLSDEMKSHYSTRNDEMIVAHKAAWDDAVAGGSTEVDYSEVSDPLDTAQYDIQERYSAEIDRHERVEDRSNSRRMLMDSITAGQRMI